MKRLELYYRPMMRKKYKACGPVFTHASAKIQDLWLVP
ncbi:unnamed protein product [Arabidopsis halleri]